MVVAVPLLGLFATFEACFNLKIPSAFIYGWPGISPPLNPSPSLIMVIHLIPISSVLIGLGSRIWKTSKPLGSLSHLSPHLVPVLFLWNTLVSRSYPLLIWSECTPRIYIPRRKQTEPRLGAFACRGHKFSGMVFL